MTHGMRTLAVATIAQLSEELFAVTLERDRLRQALEHYATRCDHCDMSEGVHDGRCMADCGSMNCAHPICEKFTNTAKAALEGEEKKWKLITNQSE